ncbi:MAG: outer membrane beta-barrel domain-containing protein [Kofleriaceae bacterium]|nr:outer membrane beta-barrel domain-containing protein [Kofleriaceae bacterium]
MLPTRALTLLLGLALVGVAVTAGAGAARADDADAPATAAAPRTAAAGDADGDAADAAPAPAAAPKIGTTAACIDQEIADRLAVKRKRRGAVDRLFVKQQRHELAVTGGYYSSDLFSGTWVAGGSYTFHMTEQTAVEFGGAYTHANADVIRAIEDARGVVLADDYARVLFAESLLIWSPVYGKLRFGGKIVHFDIHLDAGVGVIDSSTSRGASGVAGFGLKLFAGTAVAFRIDARSHVFRQELLDERFLVKDSQVTAGLSVFLPFGN